MRVVVSQLTSQGHHIEYYVRKDGGILIKSIDGKRYQGAKGNAQARQMTGVELSEARMTQLKYATATRKLLNSPRFKKIKVPDAVQKEYERVHKKWTKAFKSKKGKPHPAGYFGKVRLLKAIEREGEEGATKSISEAERYSTGIAYSKNVEFLAVFIEDAGVKYQSQELLNLAQDIRNNASAIREEWIVPAYDELYELDKGGDPKDVANNVRKILRLL